MNIKKIILLTFATLTSFFIFEISCQYIFSLNNSLIEKVEVSVFDEHIAVSGCMSFQETGAEWVPGQLSACISDLTPETSKITDFFKASLERGAVSNLILYLIWFCINTQILIALNLSLGSRNSAHYNRYFSLSEWCTNSPPMLGVLGTIFSFALMVSNTQGSPVEAFRENFMVAAATTILGGAVYVFNLLLNVVIHPALSDSK